LDHISDGVFDGCLYLESVVLPATVKVIGATCFAGCRTLANSPFPVNSEIVRIGEMAFMGCESLKSLYLPSSVEFVGDSCFNRCDLLSKLAFVLPSHLRELLDVPCRLPGPVDIPDSVEVLGLSDWSDLRREQVFNFGSQSKLREIRVRRDRLSIAVRHFSEDPPPYDQSFLQVSTRSLKVFRMKLEFEATR
jgi:hypothetical protein